MFSAKKLFLHGSVYGGSRILNQSIAFVLIPLYANLIGPDGYAVIQVMGTVSTVLGFIFLQGLHGSWFRLRFDVDGKDDLHSFETTIVWYIAFSSVAALCILSVFGTPLSNLATPGIPYYPLGLLTALTALATVFCTLYERKLQAEQRPKTFAVFSAIRTALTLGAILLFVAGLGRGARGKIEGETLALGVLAIAALILLRPGSFRHMSRFHLRRSLMYGLPLVPHNLAGVAFNLIDRLLLVRKLGLTATGVYTMGFQLAGGGRIIAEAMNQAFTPLFIESVKEAEQFDEAGDQVKAAAARLAIARMGLVVIAAISCLALCITALGREVLAIMTTAEFSESWRILAPVSAGVSAWGWYAVFSQSVRYHTRFVRFVSVITIAAAAVSLGANLVLIPRFGIMGAAWASCLSSSVFAGLSVVVGQIATPLPYDWRRLTVVLVLTSAGLAALWTIDASLESALPRVALKLVCAGVVMLIAARCAGVTPATLKQLWQFIGRRKS